MEMMGKISTQRKTGLSVTLFATNPVLIGVVSNPDLQRVNWSTTNLRATTYVETPDLP
jgi:hypothetical protein